MRPARVVWANRACLDLADRLSPPPDGAAPVWPLRPILAADGAETRAALTLPGEDDPRWFDLVAVRRGDITTVFATDATGIVATEDSRRAFVQALTRTFAHLRTGLVVFDRRRRLVLFNPAFVDLTGLRPDFLARRPHVRSILDRLREARVLPEPADWAGWRDRVATLQANAEQGSYCENWQLPDGRSLRVTGRPHPDGALAFFIEDITDDMALSRHLRRGHDMVQAALDRLPEGIAVFSETGSLMFCNAAYARRWGVLPGQPQDQSLAEALAGWRAACLPAPVWSRLAAMVAPDGTPAETEAELALVGGGRLRLHLAVLGGGPVMAVFRAVDSGNAGAAAAVPPRRTGRVKAVAHPG
ncbi:MAG: PAS-domain containing protein [Rubellimicrobium sp.]|nr:PAS-domain containing protein [Rubellimicrobium sp.]